MVNSPSTSADGQQQGVQDCLPHVRRDHPDDHGEPACPETAGGLGHCLDVHRDQPGGQRPVGVRQGQDHVAPEEHERGQLVMPDAVVDRGEADHQDDRGNGERQQAEELDGPADPLHPQLDPDHGRHQQHEHDRAGEDGQLQGDLDRAQQAWIGHDLRPGRHRPRAEGVPFQGEPDHRQERQQEERPEHRKDHVAEQVQPPAPAGLQPAPAPGRCGQRRLAECGYRSHRAARRCSRA